MDVCDVLENPDTPYRQKDIQLIILCSIFGFEVVAVKLTYNKYID